MTLHAAYLPSKPREFVYSPIVEIFTTRHSVRFFLLTGRWLQEDLQYWGLTTLSPSYDAATNHHADIEQLLGFFSTNVPNLPKGVEHVVMFCIDIEEPRRGWCISLPSWLALLFRIHGFHQFAALESRFQMKLGNAGYQWHWDDVEFLNHGLGLGVSCFISHLVC